MGDVAAGITALVKDPNTAGQTYQFVGFVHVFFFQSMIEIWKILYATIFFSPKRYKLSDLMDWIGLLTRRNAIEYGYRRLELKYMLLYQAKIYFTEMTATSNPLAGLHWEGFEKVTDTLCSFCRS